MDKENNVKVYSAKKGTKTKNGEVKKDRIYIILEGFKPDDYLEYKGKGLYKLTDHLKSWTAEKLVTPATLKNIARELERPVEDVANFQIDYVSTDQNGDAKAGLAAENELWRNRHKHNKTQQIDDDEAYWNKNQERGSIPKSERGWVEDTSGELGLDPEDWYWNIN